MFSVLSSLTRLLPTSSMPPKRRLGTPEIAETSEEDSGKHSDTERDIDLDQKKKGKTAARSAVSSRVSRAQTAEPGGGRPAANSRVSRAQTVEPEPIRPAPTSSAAAKNAVDSEVTRPVRKRRAAGARTAVSEAADSEAARPTRKQRAAGTKPADTETGRLATTSSSGRRKTAGTQTVDSEATVTAKAILDLLPMSELSWNKDPMVKEAVHKLADFLYGVAMLLLKRSG